VFAAAGATGDGALIEVADHKGAFCIGVDADQWESLPEAHPCLVSSAMKLIAIGVFELILASIDDYLPEGNFYGGVGLAPFHDHDNAVSQEMRDELAMIEAGLKAGSIPTGYKP
jgi:basic membrane protein A